MGICFANLQSMTSHQEQFLSISHSLQLSCQHFVHTQSQFSPLAEAFLCGVSSPSNPNVVAFQQLGLVHLLVVSGAHLVMLCSILEWIFLTETPSRSSPLKNLAIICLLFGFVLVTGGQPPTLRAFLAFIYRRTDRFFRWQQPPVFQHLMTGLLSLAIFPSWILSLSFYLSWVASMGLCGLIETPASNNRQKDSVLKKFFKHSLVTFQIQLLISILFSQMSALFFFANLLITPLLSWILWPLCLLSIFAPLTEPLTDPLWIRLLQFFEFLRHKFAFDSPQLLLPDPHSSSWALLWGFALSCQILFWFQSLQKYRGHYV